MKRAFVKGRNAINRSTLTRKYGVRNIKSRNRLKDNLKRLGICIIIVLLVLIIKSLDFSLTQKAADGIRSIVTKEYDFGKGLTSLRDVFPALRNKVQNVFSNENEEKTMVIPVDGPITSGYGIRVHPVFNTEKKHEGIDIGAAIGSPVRAALEGTVEEVKKDDYYGNLIVINHGDGIKTVYGHLGEVNVVSGQEVAQGEIIGSVGNTGMSTGSHLHFEVWKNGKAVDPAGEFGSTLKDM
ncbi:MAG: hypothetical protein HPY66_0857 [Firmicutes bacterium]|nr:hypothetical protein [Bacillota bacterium]MDI6706527.1 M23 family metallopeptidase [Bacillota bacterium]